MRKICVITGTRANYGRLKPVMDAIKNNDKLELNLIVTGMHLSVEHGYTIQEIEKDGYKIDAKVEMPITTDSGAGMCKALGTLLVEMTKAIENIKPDIILVLGDRDEDLAGAIIGAHMNIPVAHIHGGEVTGTIDESIRHAITKFSHIHFPATKESEKRLLKLGEIKENVFNVGSPGLDAILNRKYSSKEETFNNFTFDVKKELLIVLQHPVTTQKEYAVKQMKETLDAIKELKIQTVLIYPNSDAGGKEMINIIQQYEELPFLRAYKNINFENYLDLLMYADVMIGNSSSGIMEAPSYGLPVINLGTRQDGREQTKETLNIDHEKSLIKEAILKSIKDEEFKKAVKASKNPYGDGNTGEKIANVLANIKIDYDLIQKKITY